MAKKQTRRSISVNRQVYENSKQAAALLGVSLSQFTENALRAKQSAMVFDVVAMSRVAS